MKKIVLGISFIIVVIGIVGGVVLLQEPEPKEENKSNPDALKFKEEYEALNGKIIEDSEEEYRVITIPKDNPFIYKEADDIVEMINNKESFVVYFGFDSCPWCRSVVPTLIEVAEDMNISKIYYVDVKNIRDTITVDKDGKLKTTKEGTDGYYELIELLDGVLADYTLTDSNGKKVSAQEKRIYAPNLIAVVDGKAEILESGISEKQTDAYMELTEEIKEDTITKFKNVLEYVKNNTNTCDEGC